MNHEVEVSNLMFNKTSDDQIEFKKYDINVELEEESSNDQKTILKYSIDLTSNPKNAVINISGNTTLKGEQSEIEDFLKQEDEKTPEVVSLIYQELFPLMYIISKNMRIPSPAHTISQNNIKNPEEMNEKVDPSMEAPVEDEANNITNDENESHNGSTESESNNLTKETAENELKNNSQTNTDKEQINEDKSQ